MALLFAIAIFGLLFLLRNFGFQAKLSLSWNLFWNVFLYVLWALDALAVLAKSWSIVVVLGHLHPKLMISPSQNPPFDIMSTVALTIALYGIWYRRKWGAYLVLIRVAFTICLQIFVYHSLKWQMMRNYTGLDNVVADGMGAAMWILAFNRTWDSFR